MGSKLGVLKIAASRLGLTLDEYMAKIEAGLKWCHGCKVWQPRAVFNIDRNRGDGLAARCQSCVRVKERKSTKGRISTFKGHQHTEEAKSKMSKARKGKRTRLGKRHTIETRLKISRNNREKSPRGPACHSYKDGKAVERRDLRFSTEYKRWRFDVFARDRFTCQHCGDDRGGNLNAHHIKPFADYPDLRFDVSNGVTLCEQCHNKAHDKSDSIRKRRKTLKAT